MKILLKITLFILSSSSLYGQDTLCQITKDNVTQILEFGIKERAIEVNCNSFTDTLSFFITGNKLINDNQVFRLNNGRIAIYKFTQSKNNSLIFSPPRVKDDFIYIDFERYCAGTTIGHMILTCKSNSFEFNDISFFYRVE